jgi:hypothetical protein
MANPSRCSRSGRGEPKLGGVLNATDDENLVEMAYRWADIEDGIHSWVRGMGEEDEYAVGQVVGPALAKAFRVEARTREANSGHLQRFEM